MAALQAESVSNCARILLATTKSWRAADGVAATLADVRTALAEMIYVFGGQGFPEPAAFDLLNAKELQDTWKACVSAARAAMDGDTPRAPCGSHVVFWTAEPDNPAQIGDRQGLGLNWPYLPGSRVVRFSGPVLDGADSKPKRLFFFLEPIDPDGMILDKDISSGFWPKPDIMSPAGRVSAVQGMAAGSVVPAPARRPVLATVLFILWLCMGAYVALWIWSAVDFASNSAPQGGWLEFLFWKPLKVDATHFSLVLPFVVTLITVGLLMVAAGLALNGRWFGVIIDERNRFSLSRAQQVAWTILLLGGLGVMGWFNARVGLPTGILDAFPSMNAALWAAIGINLAVTPFLSAAILDLKDQPQQADAPVSQNIVRPAALHKNISAQDANWAELVTGETQGTDSQPDVSRLQHLVISGLLLTTYFIQLTNALAQVATPPTTFAAMPPVGQTFIGLLAFSHAGYLVFKARSKQVDSASEEGTRTTDSSP